MVRAFYRIGPPGTMPALSLQQLRALLSTVAAAFSTRVSAVQIDATGVPNLALM